MARKKFLVVITEQVVRVAEVVVFAESANMAKAAGMTYGALQRSNLLDFEDEKTGESVEVFPSDEPAAAEVFSASEQPDGLDVIECDE